MNFGGEEALALTGLASACTGIVAAKGGGTITGGRLRAFGLTGCAQARTFSNEG